jgi:hypothetical protein
MRCTFCGLESDDLRVVSRAIVRLDEWKPNGHRYEWQPRCRDRRACDLRRIEAESANDVVLA